MYVASACFKSFNIVHHHLGISDQTQRSHHTCSIADYVLFYLYAQIDQCTLVDKVVNKYSLLRTAGYMQHSACRAIVMHFTVCAHEPAHQHVYVLYQHLTVVTFACTNLCMHDDPSGILQQQCTLNPWHACVRVTGVFLCVCLYWSFLYLLPRKLLCGSSASIGNATLLASKHEILPMIHKSVLSLLSVVQPSTCTLTSLCDSLIHNVECKIDRIYQEL